MNLPKIINFFLLLLLLNSCGNYEEFKEDPSSQFRGLAPGLAISFEQVKNEIFTPNCVKCHGNYNDYQVVKGKLDAIVALVRIDVMPKDGPLSNQQKNLLFSWVEAGAPLDVNQPTPSPNPGPVPNPPTPIPLPPSQELDFATVSTKVFKPHCIACHGDFNDYTVVKTKINNILDKVRTNQMPMGSTLPADLKAILFDWAAQGAPQTGTGPTPPTPPPAPIPLEATYKSINAHIFSKKCIACHNPQGRASFLDFSNYQAIQAQASRLFDFRRPERSDIIEEIQDDERPMPPRSSSFEQVTQDEVNTLIQWIRLGIPNN